MRIKVSEDKPCAVILRFPRKRGRPKTSRAKNDRGTPELIARRRRGETTETLDLCLERGLITREQHWCGIHLRWLYTLRHGAPGVRAVDPTHVNGLPIAADDPKWRGAREREYHEAMHLLAQRRQALLLLNICIYNERPAFLHTSKSLSLRQAYLAQRVLEDLRDGLNNLARFWRQER